MAGKPNVDAIRDRGYQVRDQANDYASSLGAQASRQADQLVGRARSALATTSDNAQDFGGRLAERVRDRPIASIAAAAGVGLVVGLLIRR